MKSILIKEVIQMLEQMMPQVEFNQIEPTRTDRLYLIEWGRMAAKDYEKKVYQHQIAKLKRKLLEKQFDVEEFTIYYKGDESVGDFARSYSLNGGFNFQNPADIEDFKGEIARFFESIEDGRPTWIMTNGEYDQMIEVEKQLNQ